MKTNIKLRVTPEQSEAVQKICFANGIGWKPTDFNRNTTDVRFIFINQANLTKCVSTSLEYFEAHPYTEVDADLFIRTNGTCEESIDIVDNLSNNKSKGDMFKQYGFEVPDFDCTILTKVNNDYVGYVIAYNDVIALSWALSGNCYIGVTYIPKYNLTPIKEPWYETCKYPILVWNADSDLVAIETRKDYNDSYLSVCRPLPNAEIDRLKQDF